MPYLPINTAKRHLEIALGLQRHPISAGRHRKSQEATLGQAGTHYCQGEEG